MGRVTLCLYTYIWGERDKGRHKTYYLQKMNLKAGHVQELQEFSPISVEGNLI